MLGGVRTIWFLAAPHTGVLNIAGPWEVLGHANDVLGREAYRLELFGPGGPTVHTRHGLAVAGVRPLPTRPKRLPDVVVVAGGSPRTPLPDGEARIAAWLRRHQARIPTLV